ncbi:MAG: hypothetical protein KBB11_11220 [Bacteroidales bacterium]|nr:hypothetical protein [Bacteroidales bacterium]HOY39270.1 hypothetical protein [Bacteroidales bacterium]HQP04050.1 hypothetical protein [Bacteroidales bacterium]
MKRLFITSGLLLSACILFGQSHDKAVYSDFKAGFYDNVILKDINPDFVRTSFPKRFTMDFSGREFPTDIKKYTRSWHSAPKSQGNTGTCWCFAVTSFIESEAYRLHGLQPDLSEMYTVYWEYVDRAKDYVNTKGETYFAQGSEANAIKRLWPVYGIVPETAYSGLTGNHKFHSHDAMVDEMNEYLEKMKESGNWDLATAEKDIRGILDKYMGKPPVEFIVEGKKYTPQTYLSEYLFLKPTDYFSFMSTMAFPYNEKHELVEDDNWWHSEDYYNVTPDDFMKIINDAITNDFTVCLCGDVTEPGYDSYAEVAVVPDFDVPSELINEKSRQLRLENGSTTDDHCIHIVGYQKVGDDYWYLIKDSGSGGFDGPNKGYRFYHEDYVKLKMMNIMVYKNAARNILDKIIK